MSDEMQSASELSALIERAIAQTNDILALVREARELLGLGLSEGPLDIGPTDLPPPRDYAEYERRRIVADGMRLPFPYRDPLGG